MWMCFSARKKSPRTVGVLLVSLSNTPKEGTLKRTDPCADTPELARPREAIAQDNLNDVISNIAALIAPEAHELTKGGPCLTRGCWDLKPSGVLRAFESFFGFCGSFQFTHRLNA